MTTTDIFGYTIPDDNDVVRQGAAAMRTLGRGIDGNQGYGTCRLTAAGSLPTPGSGTTLNGVNVFSTTPAEKSGPAQWSFSAGGIRAVGRSWIVWASFSLTFAGNINGQRFAMLGSFDTAWSSLPGSASGPIPAGHSNSIFVTGGRLLTLAPGPALGIMCWQNSGGGLAITDASLNVVALRPA